MRILKDAGLMKALLLVAALVAANLYVGARANPLQAMGGTALPHSICKFQGTPAAFCEYFPLNDCIYEVCVATALEP
jgi:hypothetical protein